MGDGMRPSKQQRPSQRQGSGRADRDYGSRRDPYPHNEADERGQSPWGRRNPASSRRTRNESSRSDEWDDHSRSGDDASDDDRWDNGRWPSWGEEDERRGGVGRGARATPKTRRIYDEEDADPRRSAPRYNSRGGDARTRRRDGEQPAGAWRRLTTGFAARGQRRHAGAPRYSAAGYSEARYSEEDWTSTGEHWRHFTAGMAAVANKGRAKTRQSVRSGFLATKRSRTIAAVLLVMLLACAALPLTGIARLIQDRVTLSDATNHLKTAGTLLKDLQANPLDTARLTQTRQELAAANADFTQLSNDLSVLRSASFLPAVGDKLVSANRLAPIAITATQAGMVGLDMLLTLATKLKDPFGGNASGITPDDWQKISNDFNQLQGLFNTAVSQINTLQPADLSLDPRLGPAVATFQKELPKIHDLMGMAQTLLAIGPQLLGIGTPTSYMLEVMDSTEIRPGGGFVGQFGFMTISSGRLGEIAIQDVTLLDKPFLPDQPQIPVPSQYTWYESVAYCTCGTWWGLRDSNLDADFPTTARNGEQLLHQEGGDKLYGSKAQVKGVIAITPWLMQQVMQITGPIAVPEVKETVNPDTLINQIHSAQLGAGHGSGNEVDPKTGTSKRKTFSALLFKHFTEQVKKLLPTHMSQFLHIFQHALQTKDIQIYLNAPEGEALLQKLHIASTIEAPKTGDSFFVVDANISGAKSNYFITNTLQDQVTIDASGNALHQTTLTYAWPASDYAFKNNYGSIDAKTQYHDYVRVYMPPKAVLLDPHNWPIDPYALSTMPTAFNRSVYAGHFYLQYGLSGTITLTWTAPKAAIHDASGWHYTYLLQRQAGITWLANVQVTLPSCAAISGKPAGFKATDARHAAWSQTLATDQNFSLDYTC